MSRAEIGLRSASGTADDAFRAFRRPWVLTAAALVVVGLGALGGLVLTIATTRPDNGLGAVRLGPWLFWPDAGTPGSNPYVRARLALTGQTPLAAAEGATFVADTDDAGAPLRRACDYRLAGAVPTALFWTVAAYDRDGQTMPNGADRAAFSSREVLRDSEGRFAIELSAQAQPGNWLPLSGPGTFVVVMRLYGSALTTAGVHDLRRAMLPTVVATRCPS